jgi:lambda family phage portal protein
LSILDIFKKSRAFEETQKIAKSKRYYQGAIANRLTSDWFTTNLSADNILRWALYRLRARTRDLERNNDYARKFLREVEQNIIGHNGVKLQCQAKTKYKNLPDSDKNTEVEQAWAQWGKVSGVDGSNFRDICKLAMRRVAVDGEVLIRIIKGYDNPFNFGLQILESDLLDEKLYEDLPNGNSIVMGVEKDGYGKPVAYWLFNRYPYDLNTQGVKHIRVPAEEMIHLFMRERPTQTRGIPWFVSAIIKLRMLGAYEEAELVGARIGSAKMGFFTQSLEGAEYTGDKDENGEIISEVEPGILEKLPPGVDFKPFNPSSPNTQFENFNKALLRGISSGIGGAYNTIANDYESVNYSSLRASELEVREFWKDIQEWFISNFLDRVYNEWLPFAILSNQVSIPYTDIKRFTNIKWQARRWGWVDPLKDAQGKVLEMDNGLTTRTQILAEQGIDFEDLLIQMAEEKALAEKYGVDLSLLTSKKITPPPMNQEAQGGINGEAGTDQSQEPNNQNGN